MISKVRSITTGQTQDDPKRSEIIFKLIPMILLFCLYFKIELGYLNVVLGQEGRKKG